MSLFDQFGDEASEFCVLFTDSEGGSGFEIIHCEFPPHPQPLSPKIRNEFDPDGKLSRPNFGGEGSEDLVGSESFRGCFS